MQKKLPHEGKLTGLAAYGESTLAPKIARHFRIGHDGLVTTECPCEVEIGEAIARICAGASRETTAAMLRAVRHWLGRTGIRHLGLGGGFRQCALEPPARRKLPARRTVRLSGHGRRLLCVDTAFALLLARDGLAG